MAGHSKFKNIMHRKGAQDKKRSNLFAKLSKEITVAAKMGGEDPASNPRLRLAIQTARGQSMPKDNIQRAISKASGGDAETYEEVRYEGYGPGGIGFIVETLTDNRNRTASNVRTIFSKSGGNLGESGSVGFMFERCGEIIFKGEAGDPETVFEAAIEAGAEDVESDEDSHTIYTSSDDLHSVLASLTDAMGDPESAKLVFKPNDPVAVDKDQGEKLLKLLDALDDDDDVQNVWGSYDIPDDVAEALAS